jgi:hypothetical protein
MRKLSWYCVSGKFLADQQIKSCRIRAIILLRSGQSLPIASQLHPGQTTTATNGGRLPAYRLGPALRVRNRPRTDMFYKCVIVKVPISPISQRRVYLVEQSPSAQEIRAELPSRSLLPA